MLNFLKEFFIIEKNISPVLAFVKTPEIEDLDHALLEAVKNYRKSMFELAEKENFSASMKVLGFGTKNGLMTTVCIDK